MSHSRTAIASDELDKGPASPSIKKKRSHGPLFRIAIALLAIVAIWWTFGFVHRTLTFEETDDAYLSGHVHQISARIAGSITEVLVKENQVVKKGQALARLDPLEFQIALQEAKAALAQDQAEAQQAQAALAQSKAQLAQTQAEESSSEAQVARMQAQSQVASVNYGRDADLYRSDSRAVSKADVDTTQSAAQASTAGLDAARADVIAARARIAASEAAVNAAEAAIASAATKIDAGAAAFLDAQRQLSYVEITAPSDGRIGDKNVETGNRVQVGQALFALVDEDYWVTANFKETQLRKMQPGQPVEITVDAIGSQVLRGTVDSIAPATGSEFALLPPDNATGNFTKVVQRVPVKILLDPASIRDLQDRLRPGLSAVVSVRIK
jgi:membrane fusion protein (multidrug efflux system)